MHMWNQTSGKFLETGWLGESLNDERNKEYEAEEDDEEGFRIT